jgi:hypothetical protein
MSEDFWGIVRFFLLVFWELKWYMLVLIGMIVISTDIRYGEVARPLRGKLLRKKPLLHNQLHWAELFKVGNDGKRPMTRREMNVAYERLKATIHKQSYYRKYDQILLDQFYRRGWAEILYAEGEKQTQKKAAPKPAPVAQWRKVLGVSATETDANVIKLAYRKAVMKDHPDRGGSGKQIPVLTKAIDEARKELRFV